MRLGALTQYWESGAQSDEARKVYQANVERQTPYIVASSDEAVASAASFKDFMGTRAPVFSATLAFVDVHLIKVSGNKGESMGEG
ncbi:g8649 [Coccomyxa elongata]